MVLDFPKLESPLERKEINGEYLCIPKFKREFEWIFDKSKVIASEKFDGTDVSVIVKDGRVQEIYNRKNPIAILAGKRFHQFIEGINNALLKEYFSTEKDGQFFGELIGPKVNANPYKTEQHIWLPFEYLRKRYLYKFWYNFIDEINAGDDQDIYNKISELFKELKSRYAITHEENYLAEGIVFYNRETEEQCKLRRDMFEWYDGQRHEEEIK